MTNIVAILHEAKENTLVLYDELGAGTDPVEGAALAQSIVAHTRRLGAHIAATTHYAELKAYALTAGGVENAACEFDIETLKPTYRLLIGVPGKSNAFAISRRLGLSEDIIAAAAGQIDSGDAALEDVLSELESQRRVLEKARDDAQTHERQISEARSRADKLTGEIEAERKKAAETARADARRILDEARAAADLAYEEIARARRKAEKGETGDLQQARVDLKRQLNETEKAIGIQAELIKPQKPTRPLIVGDTVEMLRLGGQGTVMSLPDKDGKVELQAGILKVKAPLSELKLIEKQRVSVERRASAGQRDPAMRSAPIEFDIRGQAVDEALPEVDAYLDSAIAANLETVRIIHGKGTGILRAAVHKHLKANKQIKSFRLGRYGEGEDGVTVVTLK
jgi:DNA mismatch repair protein MutS2